VGTGGRHHPSYAEAFRISKLNFLELRKAEVRLRRIQLPRTPVNKGKRTARWEVTRPTTKVCRRDCTGEGVYDPRVRAFVSRRQLTDELFQHGQVVIHVLAGGGHRGRRPRADERLPHASVGKVDALEEVQLNIVVLVVLGRVARQPLRIGVSRASK
jgi:hypothetical protein